MVYQELYMSNICSWKRDMSMAQQWKTSSVNWWSSSDRALLRKKKHRKMKGAGTIWRTENLRAKGEGKAIMATAPYWASVDPTS